MFVLKYFVAQIVIVSIAFGAYFWGREIGINDYLSEIVFASSLAYFAVLVMYRREYIKRIEEEKKSFERVPQPWE
jgi:small basic protein